MDFVSFSRTCERMSFVSAVFGGPVNLLSSIFAEPVNVWISSVFVNVPVNVWISSVFDVPVIV